MKFHIWRILGNDLPPRHAETQTQDNLDFILQHESRFEGCEKKFLLNRIVDKDKENRFLAQLREAGYAVEVIPHDKKEFLSRSSMQDRLHYVTNVNAARNHCVDFSLSEGADVVCPMDGGMFFTNGGWQAFQTIAEENKNDGFFAFPTWRLVAYEDVLDEIIPQFKSMYNFGETTSYGLTELQLAVTKHADKKFNEDLLYGRADKVELLYRLGLLGLWDHWEPGLRKEAVKSPSKFFGKVKVVLPGYVCRLPSGNTIADHDNQIRGQHRMEGMNALLTTAGS